MKILSVNDLMDPATGGGATDRDYQMCRHLALAGEEVDMLTTKWRFDKEYMSRLSGVNWHAVNAVYCRYLIPFGATKWLEQNISKYDVVHISKNWSLLANLAAVAAAKQGVPYVFSGMGNVVIHNRSKWLKLLYRKYLTIPLLRRASAFVAVTNEEKQDLVDVGVAPHSVRLIPNGIIPEDFLCKDDDRFRRRHNLTEGKIILFIGRMDPVKGVHLIIDSFQKNLSELEDWILVLVGTRTPYRNEMERKVAELNLRGRVFFVDPLFGDAKSEAYHAAEFIVIPSIKDAMTIIAPEAACCRKPVLITTTSEFGELAKNEAAVEVDPTIEGLSRGLHILTAADFDRERMGQRGYDYVVNRLQWKRLIQEYVDLFQTVLSAREK